MDWVTIAVEEYKSLRQESLEAIERQHATLRFGFAGVGLLLGFGARIASDPLVAASLYMLFVPLAIVLIVVLWLGEVERMERAGAYLADLELQVGRTFFGEDPVAPLGWESWLREQGQHEASRLAGAHVAQFALFGVLAAFSVVTGMWILVSNSVGAPYMAALAIPAPLLLVSLVWWQKRYPPFETWDRQRPRVSRIDA